MTAKHPPESTPNRGYSYVGQESVSNISGFEKGLPQGEYIRDIKVPSSMHYERRKKELTMIGNIRHGLPNRHSSR